MKFELPPLSYEYDALEPFYDKETLEIHHDKHHASYVDKLNETLADFPELSEQSVEALISNPTAIPEEIRSKVLQFGGGHANHSLFWRTMGMDNTDLPSDKLSVAMEKSFGSVGGFKDKFINYASTLFGSGWTWLSIGKEGRLEMMNLPNQESPLNFGQTPILGLDLWEHAYYLKFQNRRLEWIQSWWNIVNWREVNAIYANSN